MLLLSRLLSRFGSTACNRALVPIGLTAIAFLVSAASALGQATPYLFRTEPLAIPAGKPVEVTFFGANLTGITGIWMSGPATAELLPGTETDREKNDRVTYRISLPADAPRQPMGVRIANAGGVSNLKLLAVDESPVTHDQGPNNLDTAVVLPLPAALNGHIEAEGRRYVRFAAGTGQRISFDLWARRLGSPLDAVLRILDGSGRELAYFDDTEASGADPRGSVVFANAADYFVEIRDLQYRGGSDYSYHLRIGDFDLPTPAYPLRSASDDSAQAETVEHEPNNIPSECNPLALPGVIHGRFEVAGDRDFFQFEGKQGERWQFSGQTRSLGSAADLLMRLYRADGEKLTEVDDTAGDDGLLEVKLSADGVYKLCVQELNRRAGPEYAYRMTARKYRASFLLAVEYDRYKVAAEDSERIKVTAERRGYDGPIALEVESVDGVSIADATIAEGANEATVTVTPPPTAQAGSIHHFQIWGRAAAEGVDSRVPASTLASLRGALNGLPYPPANLDGSISLGISTGRLENAK